MCSRWFFVNADYSSIPKMAASYQCITVYGIILFSNVLVRLRSIRAQYLIKPNAVIPPSRSRSQVARELRHKEKESLFLPSFLPSHSSLLEYRGTNMEVGNSGRGYYYAYYKSLKKVGLFLNSYCKLLFSYCKSLFSYCKSLFSYYTSQFSLAASHGLYLERLDFTSVRAGPLDTAASKLLLTLIVTFLSK